MKKILIADDEKPTRFATRQILRRSGFNVLEASNGNEALDIIKDALKTDEPVELILLDLNMPDKTGTELMGDLAEIENSPQVIIITGTIDSEELVEIRKHNPFTILNKPFGSKDLIQTVNNALGE